MSERTRERRRPITERKPLEFGTPARLSEPIYIALPSIPNIGEKNVEAGAKIALALLFSYDPQTKQWYPQTTSRGTPETLAKGYKPDTNSYEYIRLDDKYYLYVHDVPVESVLKSQLDVALSVLAVLNRWGRNVAPKWIFGSEVSAPAANTSLVSITVSTGKLGYIYGIFIAASEANHFKINWTSGATARSIRIVLGGPGTIESVDIIPLNEGLPADSNTTISITVVNAGSVGSVYQAGILYAET